MIHGGQWLGAAFAGLHAVGAFVFLYFLFSIAKSLKQIAACLEKKQ